MIIGVTGSICSGTDSFGAVLKEKGFIWFSFSDILREELTKRKIDITRSGLQDMGDALRKREGSGVLSRRIIEKMVAGGDYVVGNIRNPGEVREFKNLGDFVLVKVEALEEVRFKRLLERGRESDPADLEGFKKLEEKDLGIGQEKHGQQHGIVFEMAEKFLDNSKGIAELRIETEKLLNELGWEK